MSDQIPVRLALPPLAVRCGVGVHGPGDERFRMDGMWQLQRYRYSATIMAGTSDLSIRPGSISVVPPGMATRYRFPAQATHLYVHLRLPDGPADAYLPLHRCDPALAGEFDAAHAEAMAWQHDRPTRSLARLWHLLWRLAEPAEPADDDGAAALRRAIAHLEANLGRPLRIAAAARAAGIPHNRLLRLFHRHLATTPLAWLQRRRAETAAHLIRATDRPLGSIAAEVGLPDRQHFNKVIRRLLGVPPSRLRRPLAEA